VKINCPEQGYFSFDPHSVSQFIGEKKKRCNHDRTASEKKGTLERKILEQRITLYLSIDVKQ